MGMAKAAMLEHQENLAAAASYLVDIGWLSHCEHHGVTFGGAEWDLESDFWKKAVGDWKRGENGPVPWAAGLGVREFTDIVKETYESHPGEQCFPCAKIMDE